MEDNLRVPEKNLPGKQIGLKQVNKKVKEQSYHISQKIFD